jgi:hypothetical protein
MSVDIRKQWVCLRRGKMEKKNWTTPELIVLVRNNPEESVLATCKTFGNPITAGLQYDTCRNSVEGFICNEDCSESLTS